MTTIKINYLFMLAVLVSLLLLSTTIVQAQENHNQINFALVSDVHVDINNNKPVNINPDSSNRGSDLDKASFVTLVSKLSNHLTVLPEKPSFILTLGDLPSHNARVSRKDKYLKFVYENFYNKFFPMTQMYSFGNNDSLERNYGRFNNNMKSPYEVLKSLTGKDGFISNDKQCPFINAPCIINENKEYGYYSTYIGDHLKLISLNSVIFTSRPGYFPDRNGDEEQLQWLKNEIKNSQTNNEQVILAMHVAPNSWEPNYAASFKNIIKDYPQAVIALLAGHSHLDELRVIKSNDTLIPVIFSAGLSTAHQNSSSFKTVSVTRESNTNPWHIDNYITYYFNGNRADASTITKYYDFKSAFCPADTVSFNVCLSKQIQKSGSHYQYNAKASKLLSDHYYSNPSVPGDINAAYWVMNY